MQLPVIDANSIPNKETLRRKTGNEILNIVRQLFVIKCWTLIGSRCTKQQDAHGFNDLSRLRFAQLGSKGGGFRISLHLLYEYSLGLD